MKDQKAQIEQLLKDLRQRELTIQGKDEGIAQRNGRIEELQDELERMRQAAANGDLNSAELSRQLQETQEQLRQALEKIANLEKTMQENHSKYQGEYSRLNTEIEHRPLFDKTLSRRQALSWPHGIRFFGQQTAVTRPLLLSPNKFFTVAIQRPGVIGCHPFSRNRRAFCRSQSRFFWVSRLS